LIGYIEELPGYIGLKIGYLNVFTHVLHCLEGIGEVRVTAYQYCNVIEIKGIKELLLFTLTFSSLGRRLQYIVIVCSEQTSRSTELNGKVREIKVISTQVRAQRVIKVASIDEDCYPFFHNSPLINATFLQLNCKLLHI